VPSGKSLLKLCLKKIRRAAHVHKRLSLLRPAPLPANPVFFKGSPVTDKGDWLLFDLGLALQNLTLAAYEKGLGTVHVGFFDSVKAGAVLGVPEGHTVVELLPLGHPAEEGRVTPRKPIEEFVFYNGYGRKA